MLRSTIKEIINFKSLSIKTTTNRAQLELFDKYKDEIDSTWNENKTDYMHNSEMLSIQSHNVHNNHLEIEVNVVEYKHYIAQKKSSLELLVTPLGVSGITVVKDCFILGKRGDSVTLYKNYSELVPSGTIDVGSTWEKQILDELFEECAISSSSVNSLKPFCLIFDELNKVYDIGIEIKLNDSYMFSPPDTIEYKNLELVKIKEFNGFSDFENVVPTTVDLYQSWLIRRSDKND